MTGRDNQRVCRGYQGGCHIWIYFISLSVICLASGYRRNQKRGRFGIKMRLYVVKSIYISRHVTFGIMQGQRRRISLCFKMLIEHFVKLLQRSNQFLSLLNVRLICIKEMPKQIVSSMRRNHTSIKYTYTET